TRPPSLEEQQPDLRAQLKIFRLEQAFPSDTRAQRTTRSPYPAASAPHRKGPAMPTWTLHRGDAYTLLRTLPDESVSATITDPPYNSGGTATTARTGNTARGKYVRGDAQHDLPDFDGDQRDQRSYTVRLTLILTECYRATTRGGPLLRFTDFPPL